MGLKEKIIISSFTIAVVSAVLILAPQDYKQPESYYIDEDNNENNEDNNENNEEDNNIKNLNGRTII